FGPARYSASYHTKADQTVTTVFRFDSGKRRLTPAKLEAFQTEMKKLGERRIPQITFHQVGEAALEAGRIREALAEFRRLDAEHAKTALHACQIAHAYLQAGLASAARVQARRAVEIEPRSPRAH